MKKTAKTVQTVKRTAAKLVFSLAVCGLVAPTVANAQVFAPLFPFTDDFQDGAASDDAPVSYVPGTTPATITMVNHDMVLTEPIQVATWSLGLTIVQKSGKAVGSGDVSAQTVVRVSDSLTYGGIYMQGQALPPDGDGGAYVGFIRGDGGITAGSYLVAPQQTLQTPLNPVSSDVVLRMDCVGVNVTITAWAAEDPSRKYSLTVVGPVTRPPGFIGQCFGRSGPDPTGSSATFRSFGVVVPPTLKIELGAIRAPKVPTEIPAVSWEDSALINGPNVSFTADGKEVFLSNRVAGNHDLYVASRATPNDPWGAVQPVGAPVNSANVEYFPTISADGLILMWSDGQRNSGLLGARPGGRGGSDLWMSTRADRASLWSAPVNLGPQVNSGNYEEFPHLTADGLELFFCRDNGSGAKLYSSRRANLAAPWQQAVLLPNYINFPDGQWLALPSPDGLTLFTGNIVSGSPYPADILVLTRQDRNSPWNRPVSLGAAINSPWSQAMPLVLTPDGSALYFKHDTGIGTIANGYLIKRVELLPMLGIARADSPTPKVTVSYSSIFNQAVLENSDNFVDWAPVLQAAVVEYGENHVTLPVSSRGREFFRLARP